MNEAGWGFAPGTFGELVQGELQNTPFLVTLPIRWGTRAAFFPGRHAHVEVYPAYRSKARRAAEEAARLLKRPGGALSISSVIPVGKGMASSSADIVASMRAVAAAYRKTISPAHMARIAAAIEPSDGIMYPGIVAINPLTGLLLERFGPIPPAVIVGLVGPGRINTADHHRRREAYTASQQGRLAEAVRLLRKAAELRQVGLLGQAGRISAEVQAERDSEDAMLAELLAKARRENWGMVIAHTGTVRGYLFAPSELRRGAVANAEKYLRELACGPVFRFWTQSAPIEVQGPLARDWQGAIDSSPSVLDGEADTCG